MIHDRDAIEVMVKPSYRVVIRKNGRTSDVEMTESGTEPRIVQTFNSEAEAWDWISEQNHLAEFAARPVHRRKDTHD